MITDEIIKTRFITEILTADLDRIKSDQLSRLHGVPERARRRFDIPRITAALRTQARTTSTTSTTVTVTEHLDLRIRYLDIRRLGNLRIYNKVLFPLLYRSALPRIQYSFTQAVRQRIHNSLTDALHPLNP